MRQKYIVRYERLEDPGYGAAQRRIPYSEEFPSLVEAAEFAHNQNKAGKFHLLGVDHVQHVKTYGADAIQAVIDAMQFK